MIFMEKSGNQIKEYDILDACIVRIIGEHMGGNRV
jgi:hypothetical protein